MKEREARPLSTSQDQELAFALAVAIRTAAYYRADNTVLQQACSSLDSILRERVKASGSVAVAVYSH